MAGGADIELLFGVLGGGSPSGASGQKIRNQLSNIIGNINKNPIGIKLKLEDSNGKDFSRQIKSLATLAKKEQITTTVKVTSFDTTQALASFKSDLQKIVNSLSLETGKTITISADVGAIESDVKKVGDSAKNAAQDVSKFAGALKEIKQTQSSISKKTGSLRSSLGVSDEDIAKSEQLRAAIVNLNNEQAKLQTMMKSGASEAEIQDQITKVQQLQLEMIKLNTSVQAYIDAQKAAGNSGKKSDNDKEASLKKIVNLYRQITNYLSKNPMAAQSEFADDLLKHKAHLEEVISAYARGEEAQEKFTNADFSDTTNSLDLLKGAARAANLEGNTLMQTILGMYAKFGGWQIVVKSMQFMSRQFKKVYENVKEIDAAMTELKKVTNETDATYAKFLDTAATRAKQVGASVSDVVNASADFARLGYDITEASTLADTAIVYKNVADGIDDISEASDSIVSTMQAFGIEASEAMTIVDKFNEVSNNYAISSEGIGEALQRSAAAMYAAGNTIDETIALATAANTVVQNPETVGKTCPTT